MKRKLGWINITNFAWVTVIAHIVLYVSNALIAENTRWTWLLHSLPQIGFALFPLALFIAAVLKRRWRLVVLATAVLVVYPFAFLGLVYGTPLEEQSADLVVVTYNIHGGESPFPPIERTIKEMGADVLCLEETNDNRQPGKIHGLAERLGYPHTAINGEMAILSRYPIVKTEIFPIHGLPSYRYGIQATISFRGKAVDIVAVHLLPMLLDYIVRDGFPEGLDTMLWISKTGLKQAELLSERYHDWPNPVIVAGDHNFNPNGMRYRAMAAEFEDSFAKVGRGFGYTIPSNAPMMRIDYVWTKGCEPVTCYPFPSKSSDHKPLMAHVRLR